MNNKQGFSDLLLEMFLTHKLTREHSHLCIHKCFFDLAEKDETRMAFCRGFPDKEGVLYLTHFWHFWFLNNFLPLESCQFWRRGKWCIVQSFGDVKILSKCVSEFSYISRVGTENNCFPARLQTYQRSWKCTQKKNILQI